MGVILWSFSMILHKIHQNPPEYRLVIAFKQIFQLETIHCLYLDDTLNRLVGNTYLNVTFMCFSVLVAFSPFLMIYAHMNATFRVLSRIHLRITNDSWHTGPDESVLNFQFVLVVWWHLILRFA